MVEGERVWGVRKRVKERESGGGKVLGFGEKRMRG